MSNKLGQSPRRTRIPLSGILGGRQRPTLCQRRALTKHCGVSAPLHVFLLLLLSFERRSGNPPPPFPSPASCASEHRRVYWGRLPWHQSGVTGVLLFTSAAGSAEAALSVLTGMSVPTQPSHDILAANRGADANTPASIPPDNPVFTFQRRAAGIVTPPDLAAVPLSSGC